MLLCRLFALRPVSLNNFIVDGDGLNGNTSNNVNGQIWAVDSSLFGNKLQKTTNGSKASSEITAGESLLQPVYVLQPGVDVSGISSLSNVTNGSRGYKRYDRGRSFSPPKPHHRRKIHHQSNVNRDQFRFEDINQEHHQSSSAPHNVNQQNGERNNLPSTSFVQHHTFKKSFSSEQLYFGDKNHQHHHEPYSFSMSSRSSSTSTGSSTRSGIWQRDFRSGIPVPISSDTRLRLRNHHVGSGNTTGPLIARRAVNESSVSSSPVSAEQTHDQQINKGLEALNLAPPRSSGSESSGYFTPPPDAHHAFVKLDTEEHLSEEDEDNNGQQTSRMAEDVVDNAQRAVVQSPQDNIQRQLSVSSGETSEISDVDTQKQTHVVHETISVDNDNNIYPQTTTTKLYSASPALREIEYIPKLTEIRNKSKSVIELTNNSMLPEIDSSTSTTSTRKNINSAPPLNDNINVINNNNGEPIIINSTNTIVLPGSLEIYTNEVQDDENVLDNAIGIKSAKDSGGTSARKLVKRFERSQSRRSVNLKTPRTSGSLVEEMDMNKLRPFSRPKEGLQMALAQMENNEWEITMRGIQGLIRVTRFHPEVVEAHMHAVCVSLGKHVKNLRSQVARTACTAASELFCTCKKGIDMEADEIAPPLLQRAADTNRFLRSDANSALDTMCEFLPPSRVVAILTCKGCVHQNPLVRAASARLLSDLVNRHGPDKILQLSKETRDRILLAAANSLTDGNLDARRYSKSLLSVLVNHHSFQKALLEAVPQTTLRHIAKTLSNLKAHTGTTS